MRGLIAVVLRENAGLEIGVELGPGAAARVPSSPCPQSQWWKTRWRAPSSTQCILRGCPRGVRSGFLCLHRRWRVRSHDDRRLRLSIGVPHWRAPEVFSVLRGFRVHSMRSPLHCSFSLPCTVHFSGDAGVALGRGLARRAKRGFFGADLPARPLHCVAPMVCARREHLS